MNIKSFLAASLASVFMLLHSLSGVLIVLADEVVAPPPEDPNFYLQTFIITAYYSPLLDQVHYVTGSYEGDIYLNGNGTNGADGTPVYPGMIAAPSTYAFGTKMYIPGVGLTAVHDRGGAIKSAGERGNVYDRLDIWMGQGDEGLRKALGWGKRTIEVQVYGINSALTEAVYFEQYLSVENFFTQTFLTPLKFPNDIYYGTDGEEVKKMQQHLVDWGYLSEANGFYGSDTAQALFQFQMDFGIVSSGDELGVGHFGPMTRRKFDELIHDDELSEDRVKLQKGKVLMQKHSDLYEVENLFGTALSQGDSGSTVMKLQEELRRLGFLRIEATGYFGETTAHALFKFQQSQNIVANKTDSGAGYLGPQTRTALNNILEARFDTKSLMAYQREELEQGRLALMLPDQTLARLTKED